MGVRGSVAVNPLDPPYPAVDVSSFKSWKLTVNQAMPAPEKSFSYWCSIHRYIKLNIRYSTKFQIFTKINHKIDTDLNLIQFTTVQKEKPCCWGQ